jgi:hypothetical protein
VICNHRKLKISIGKLRTSIQINSLFKSSGNCRQNVAIRTRFCFSTLSFQSRPHSEFPQCYCEKNLTIIKSRFQMQNMPATHHAVQFILITSKQNFVAPNARNEFAVIFVSASVFAFNCLVNCSKPRSTIVKVIVNGTHLCMVLDAASKSFDRAYTTFAVARISFYMSRRRLHTPSWLALGV